MYSITVTFGTVKTSRCPAKHFRSLDAATDVNFPKLGKGECWYILSREKNCIEDEVVLKMRSSETASLS